MSDTLRVSNLHFGNAASNNNQPQMGFTSVGIGSTANYGFLQFFGTSNTLCWTANGTVGIGTTNPGYTIDVNGSSSAVGLSILRSTTTSGSGRISYYNNTGSVAYWLLGSISSLVGNYGGSIDINGDLVRVDTALKNIQFGCSVNYSNFTVNRSSASGTTGTINGNIVVYRNTTTSLYDVYLVFGSYSSFVGDIIYSNTSSINLTPNFVTAPSASGTYILAWDHSVNTYMAITNSGNVGIGTTNPTTTLHVVGSTSVGTPAVVSFVNNGTGQNGTGSDIVNSQITMGLYGPYIRSVQRNSAYTDGMRLDLCTNIGSNDGAPVPRISILSGLFGGYVGIGTVTPIAPLHVVNPSNGLTSVQYAGINGSVAGSGAQWYTVVGNYPCSSAGTVLTIPIVNQMGNWSTTMIRIRGFNGRYNTTAVYYFTAECVANTLGTGYGNFSSISVGGNASSITFNGTTVSVLVNFSNAYGSGGSIALVIEYLSTIPAVTIIPASISVN